MQVWDPVSARYLPELLLVMRGAFSHQLSARSAWPTEMMHRSTFKVWSPASGLLKGPRGLTLPEILIAASVLTVALLAMAGMFPTAFQNVKAGGQMTKATAIAQKMMEFIRNQSFSSLTSYNGLNNTSNCNALSEPAKTACNTWKSDITFSSDEGKGLPSGSWSIAVSSPATDLRQVTVTVGWTERTGSKMVELVTYVADY